jgi:hypothetical protein
MRKVLFVIMLESWVVLNLAAEPNSQKTEIPRDQFPCVLDAKST